MSTSEWNLECNGFRILPRAVDVKMVERLLAVFDDAFGDDSQSVRARSSRGQVSAARDLIESIPEVTDVWQSDPMLRQLREALGDRFGLAIPQLSITVSSCSTADFTQGIVPDGLLCRVIVDWEMTIIDFQGQQIHGR